MTTDTLQTDACPQWRELGPDETIQEGDEFKSDDRGWRPVHYWAIGKNSSYFILHFRTHRPLPPVVDQTQSITK
jgi:hypothetical protein